MKDYFRWLRAVGQCICNKRTALGMTQIELAEKIGITEKTISKYEKGAFGNVAAKNVRNLIEMLEITENDVLAVEASLAISDALYRRNGVRP